MHSNFGIDVPVFAEHQEVKANRVDALIINHESKRVITQEMSCPWVTNREKKEEEKATKYGPLRWVLKQKYQGYEVKQYNIIMDVLGTWCRDLEVKLKEVRVREFIILMQKAVLSGTLTKHRSDV